MIEIRQNQRKPYNLELAWPTTTVVVRQLFVMRTAFFDKIFHLMFLLYFSVIRWNFGIVLVLFNGGVLLLVEWT